MVFSPGVVVFNFQVLEFSVIIRDRMLKNQHSNTLTVCKELNGRRLDFVIAYLTGLSRRESRRMVENGSVLLNRMRETFPSRKLRTGDRIAIVESDSTAAIDPEIIYEDDAIIVVNKPTGLLTLKMESETGQALTDILAKMGKSVFPVHRLDRDTSGIIIFAKTQQAREFMIEEFRKRRVDKKYIGVVDGILKDSKGVIKGKIGSTGEFAETHFKVLRVLKNATMVEFVPKTGRTHQLRLQFFEIGHPVVGDKKYYRKKSTIIFPRQALHSYKIHFLHPRTNKRVCFTAPVPEDILQLINYLAN